MDCSPGNENQPLCKFGPGGEFVSIWPGGPERAAHSDTSLPGRLLSFVTDIMPTLLGAAPAGVLSDPQNGTPPSRGLSRRKEKTGYEIRPDDKPHQSLNAPTASTFEDDSHFSGQQLLFADNCGAGLRIGRKPKHNIRAHRTASRKRLAFRIAGQGSLFEPDFKGAKTA